MAIKGEHLERYRWWINEFESLSISVKKTNQFNDLKAISNLAEIIKTEPLKNIKWNNIQAVIVISLNGLTYFNEH
jgi:hypothetical protein